jgi:Ca-activated chloride channel homolog
MRKTAVVYAMVLGAVWLSVRPLYAEDGDKVLSPYFYVESGAEGQESFPLKATNVTALISGVIADVRVTQTYANTGTQPISARYVFPASTPAAVHGIWWWSPMGSSPRRKRFSAGSPIRWGSATSLPSG